MSFNWEIYKELNPDLLKAGLRTREDYEKHFLVHGLKECRPGIPSNKFDWQIYRQLNPDLIKAGLNTKEQLEKHYMINGIKENRKYCIIANIVKKPKQIEKDKILFIMGNGPSLGEIMNNPTYLNFIRKHDSFGLNSAYRAYKKYNFYPTYFGCFDYLVNTSHKKEFENLVLSNNGIKEFYFIGDEVRKQSLYSQNVYNNSKFIKFNFIHIDVNSYKGISRNFNNYYNPGSSGANALQIGIMKGYKKIVLLGCDCKYVEVLKEAKQVSDSKLEIVKNIDNNPNYWFNDYQQVGDKYNVPNTNKFQHGSWNNINKYYPKNIDIINCSMVSTIPYFKKVQFKDVMNSV
jgi:hypothetical protein